MSFAVALSPYRIIRLTLGCPKQRSLVLIITSCNFKPNFASGHYHFAALRLKLKLLIRHDHMLSTTFFFDFAKMEKHVSNM
jgi:hypothetical protein